MSIVASRNFMKDFKIVFSHLFILPLTINRFLNNKRPEAFAQKNQDENQWVKTCNESMQLTIFGMPEVYQEKWPKAGLLINNIAYNLQDEFSNQNNASDDEVGWSTPNTLDSLPLRSPEALSHQAETARKGRKYPANLREQVDPESVQIYHDKTQNASWPTPRSQEPGRTSSGYGRGLQELVEGKEQIGATAFRERDTSTQTAFDSSSPSNKEEAGEQKINKYRCVQEEVSDEEVALNPEWVECLMGFPVGWTAR